MSLRHAQSRLPTFFFQARRGYASGKASNSPLLLRTLSRSASFPWAGRIILRIPESPKLRPLHTRVPQRSSAAADSNAAGPGGWPKCHSEVRPISFCLPRSSTASQADDVWLSCCREAAVGCHLVAAEAMPRQTAFALICPNWTASSIPTPACSAKNRHVLRACA